jgi:UDP-N-acetylglucosamine 4,6-dehydratase/5-epimerase
MEKLFKNKNILITGGTGSLGVEIVKELVNYKPNVIRIFSRDETKQFELQNMFRKQKNIRYLLGDIRDKDRLAFAVKDIDIILHVAALKHVPACEYNPFEAVKTNVVGTANIIEAAINAGVSRVIFTSTDKATNPCNTMGVSKLLAERLITAGHYYSGEHKTIMSTVRFGNVLGSRGSVIPLWKKQILDGGPVTLTDPDMTRFVMSIKESIKLMFESLKIAKGGEVFILKMPVVRIEDLAEVMIKEIGSKAGYKEQDIKIEKIGTKPGEKMYEELITGEEMGRALDLGSMFALLPHVEAFWDRELKYKNAKSVTQEVYASNKEKPLTQEEIKDLLKTAELL